MGGGGWVGVSAIFPGTSPESLCFGIIDLFPVVWAKEYILFLG